MPLKVFALGRDPWIRAESEGAVRPTCEVARRASQQLRLCDEIR